MTRLLIRLILFAALLAGAGGAANAAGPGLIGDPVVAHLIPETRQIAPGETFWVDLHLDIAKGWHTYWRNPGDSGLPTEMQWTLPAGFSAGEIAWPPPERFVLGTIGNYGYAGSADLLVPITAPTELESGGTAHLAGKAIWLACSEICVPGEATLALDLPVGTAPTAPDPAIAARFAALRERLPQPARFETRFTASEHELRLSVPSSAFRGGGQATVSFFPFDANVIDAATTPRQETRSGGIDLVLARASGPTAALPTALGGVLVVHNIDGTEHSYLITANPAPPGSGDDTAGVLWWQALLLAALGGLTLNLMPCVFPVLSLKVLGLAGSAHRDGEWRNGIAYAAGVVLSFIALGGALLLLRSGGAAIGWGFQLQSPVIVGLLAYLLFAMGLGLSGVAEFGAGLAGLGSRFTDHAGVAGAFATGILATIVATPCTAPFMGTALGFALVAPTPLALAVFAALGCGLAAPFALASAVPAIGRLLPKPGIWMVWFKQLLAFPLYATVAWLVWVLVQETGPEAAFAALIGLVATGFAVWIYGSTRLVGARGRRLGAGLALAGLASAVFVASTLTSAGARPGATASVAGGTLGYQRFSPSRLVGLTAEHQPVFVNLTAAWCITCLVNEHTALDSAAVRRAFADHGIVALKGDWTRQDPDITAFLEKFGRSGVPLYLLYDKGGTPTVLPQILTEAGVLSALSRI
ncbi:MAG TPA: protein-disulfide reductase DsbD domain-containing protein [Stellaceae bacterium]|jgi:thiol:disulfide interchange protein DsbD|nr:protein-disulfide reductase DsbD domain-containing protein [Stellaceae bacterium]